VTPAGWRRRRRAATVLASATRRLALLRPSATVPVAFIIALTLAATAQAAPPVAVLSGPSSGTTGAPLSFDGSASTDPDGGPLTFAWTIDGEDVGVEHAWLAVSFAHPGTHVVTLAITDGEGLTATSDRVVRVTGADRDSGSLHPLSGTLGDLTAQTPELVLKPPTDRLRAHRLRLVARCSNATACQGTLRAVALVGPRERPVLLAARRFRLTPGRSHVVHVRLDAAARRKLGRRTKVRVTAYFGRRVRVAGIWAVQSYTVHVAR
jgi:hypothetical protein